jgi:hypothetical protein
LLSSELELFFFPKYFLIEFLASLDPAAFGLVFLVGFVDLEVLAALDEEASSLSSILISSSSFFLAFGFV